MQYLNLGLFTSSSTPEMITWCSPPSPLPSLPVHTAVTHELNNKPTQSWRLHSPLIEHLLSSHTPAVTTWPQHDLSNDWSQRALPLWVPSSVLMTSHSSSSPDVRMTVHCVWSYLGVELRQLLFIKVSLGVDTSFIAELKHRHKKRLWAVICILTAKKIACFQKDNEFLYTGFILC